MVLTIIFPVVLLLWAITLVIPGIYWLIIRLLIKNALGMSYEDNITFELLLLGAGFISGKLINFLFFTPYGAFVLPYKTWNLLVMSIVPYLIMGLIDAIFALMGRTNVELASRERAILVLVPLYLSMALVGLIFLAWDMASRSGV